MKSRIVPIIIIVGLSILPAMTICKEFKRHDDVQTVQRENSTTNRKTLVSVPETKPGSELKPAVETKNVAEAMPETEAKPVTKPKTEAKPSEVKPVTETKNSRNQALAQTNPEEKAKPAAVPVVTAEEAEKLNAEAMFFFQPIFNKEAHVKMGFKKVFDDKFNKYKTFKYPIEQAALLQEKGYNLNEFNKRIIPNNWTLDIKNLPKAALFQKGVDNYSISAETGFIQFLGPEFDCMGYSFFFELDIKNESEGANCEVELGVFNNGPQNNGYSLIKKETLAPGLEKKIQWEISVYDLYSDIKPTISLNGTATLKHIEIYRLMHQDFTIVEGTIIDRSLLPDPSTTDYPDCRYTAQFIGNSIVRGNPCNKEIVLSVDGFIDKKILPSNKLKKSDKIKCAIVRFDSVPEELSKTQEVDNLSLFSLDSYLLTSYIILESFSDVTEDNSEVVFLDSTRQEYISIYKKKINPSMSEESINIQKDTIEQDLKRINNLIQLYSDEKKKKINEDFCEVWEKEQKKDPSGRNRANKTVWRNMDDSFYALPEKYNIIEDYPTITPNNMRALVAFKDYLESQGIQLIVSLVPHFYDISARVINHDYVNLPDFRTAIIVKQLLENKIEALYSSDIIIGKYNEYDNPFLYPTNAHPGDLPQDVLSDILAERLSRFSFSRQLNKSDFQVKKSLLQVDSIRFPDNCDIGSHQVGDYFSYNHILYRNKEIIRKHDTGSPVLVLGNSYSSTPELISRYLAMKTGVNIDHYLVTGYGVLSTAIQRIYNNPEYFLSGRKIIILSLGTIHLTADVVFPNIHDLDTEASLIHNLHLSKTIKIHGNVQSIPSFALQLSDPSIFRTDKNGELSITIESVNSTSSKESYIVLFYCCDITDRFELIINDFSYPLSGSAQQYIWSKKIIPIDKNNDMPSIKFVGKPNAFIALGDIQVWQ